MASILNLPVFPVASEWAKELGIPGQDGSGAPITVRLPDWQVACKQYIESTSTIPLSNVSTNALSTTSMTSGLLNAGTATRITDAHLRISLSVAGGPLQFVPTPFFYSRLDIVQTSGSAVPLATFYGDTQHSWLQTCVKQSDLVSKMKLMGYNTDVNGFMNLPARPTLPNIGIKTLYYYLSSTFFNESLAVFWASGNTNLLFNMYPNTSIIASGTGTYTLLSLSIILQSQNLIPRDWAMEANDAAIFPSATRYLDPQVVLSGTNQSINAGVKFQVDCSNINGRVSHLLVCIRPQGTDNTNGGYLRNLVSIGTDATIDYVSPAGVSLVSSNNPWYGSYLVNELMNDQAINDSYSKAPGMYIIPFGRSIPRAYQGTQNGFLYQTSNTHNRLEITPTVPVAEVYTITKPSANAATSGTFRFYVAGTNDFSIDNGSGGYGNIPYNATTTQLATALASIATLAAKGVTANNITVSNAFTDTTATIVITISYPREDGLSGHTIQVIPDNLVINSAMSSPTSVLTTQGKSGLATAVYNIVVYAFMYRTMVYSGGAFSYTDDGAPTYLPMSTAVKYSDIRELGRDKFPVDPNITPVLQ